MTKLAEILSGPETWMQGRSSDGRAKRCLIGALAALGLDGPEERARLRRVIRQEFGVAMKDVHELNPMAFDPIASWQDARERTWPEIARVVEAYDRDRLLEALQTGDA